MQEDARERAKKLDEGVCAAVNDPRRPLTAAGRDCRASGAELRAARERRHRAHRQRRPPAGGRPGGAAVAGGSRRVNAKLRQAERQLTDPAGLPGRPWFRHLLYAPGLYTGYGVKTIPGVREAIEQKQLRHVEAEVARAAAAIDRLAALLDEASASWRRRP